MSSHTIGCALSCAAMASFMVGDRVVLKHGLPQRSDHVGIITALEPDTSVWVQWSGPEAIDKPVRMAVGALERA